MCAGTSLRLSTVLLVAVMWTAAAEDSTATMDRTLQLRPRPFLSALMNFSPARNQDTVVTCGEASDSEWTVWQSPEYPQREEHLPGLCTLALTPPSDTCALRVMFDDLYIVSHAPGSCEHNSVVFKMSYSKGVTPAICSAVTGYEGVLEVDPQSYNPLVLLLELDPTLSFKFKISITAVACKDIHQYRSPNICGIKNQLTFPPGKPGETSSNPEDVTTKLPHRGATVVRNESTVTQSKEIPPQDRSTAAADDDDDEEEEEEEEVLAPEASDEAGQEREPRGRRRFNKSDSHRRSLIKTLKKNGDFLSSSLASGIQAGVVDVLNPVRQRFSQLDDSRIGEWPWMVAIERKITEEYGKIERMKPCTGVLLDHAHVLTAASCFLPTHKIGSVQLKDMKVLVGDHDYNKSDEIDHLRVDVSRVTFPLTFDYKFSGHDLAVLTLDTPVDYTGHVRPACLPVKHNVFPKQRGLVAGWTRDTSYYSSKKTSLLVAKVLVLPQAECTEKISSLVWPKEHRKIKFDEGGFMCSATHYYSSPVCIFGPGVPLVQRDRTGAHYLMGVNAGRATCGTNFPDLYTRVAAHQWFLDLALSYNS